MELNYLLLLGFLFYLSIGIFLIVKNNNVSSSSRYLGLFFIALGFSPLSLYLFNISLDDSFVLPYLIFQTHMFWFYYYVNAVIGNKISKFNLYFSLTFFTFIFIIHIYSVIEIFIKCEIYIYIYILLIKQFKKLLFFNCFTHNSACLIKVLIKIDVCKIF